jgi:hypothetical protein
MMFYWLLMPHIFLLHTKMGLQPILIGTSLKQILGTIEANAFASDFASLKQILGTIEANAFASDFASILAPYQYHVTLMEGSCLQWLFGILCMTCFLELPT